MTTRDDFDRDLTAWLMADAPMGEPEHLLGEVLARTARTRRRPAWRIPERWIPMSVLSTSAAAAPRVPWRFLAIAAAILALLGAAAFAVGSRQHRLAPPFGPAANGAIAFSKDGDIYVLDEPTGQPRLLVGGAETDIFPLFAPDGSTMVYLRADSPSSQQVMIATADGNGIRPIGSPFAVQPSWAEVSPQGDAVALLTDLDRSVITLLSTDGGPTQVIPTGLAETEAVVFRPPDGRQLTFRGKDLDGTWGLYVIDRDGTGLTRLALDKGFQGDPYYPENSDYYFIGPTWSPDGRTLAFHTLEPDPTSPAGPGFRIHLASLDAKGAVTDETTLEFDRSHDDEYAPVWLPEGQRMLFQTVEGATHTMALATVVPTVGLAHDLGVTARDWISTLVAPDGRSAIMQLPQGDGSKPLVRIDLDSLAITPIDAGGDDLDWQRRAP